MQVAVAPTFRTVADGGVAAAVRRGLAAALRWLLPSMADLAYLSCLGIALATGAVMLSADGDPARHLTVGEYILSTGTIPRVDVFSYTMGGQPFTPYEWLAEVFSAASARAAGLAGPVLLHGAVIALAFTILLRQLRAGGRGVLLPFALTGLAVMASALHWLARPHVFTFLGVAFFEATLDGWFAGRLSARRLWALPLAMLLWANLHGGFLVGLILVGAYLGCDLLRWAGASGDEAQAARRRLRQLAPVAALTLAATLGTPAGTALLPHVTGYFSKTLLVDRTQEYRSPDFHHDGVGPFLALLLGTGAAMALSRRRPALHEVALFGAFTYFSLYSVRNVPLFALVVTPMLARQLAGLPGVASFDGRAAALVGRVQGWLAARDAVYSRMDRRSRGGVWPLGALVALVALAIVQYRGGGQPLGMQFHESRQPVAAVAYLQAHPPAGRMFNSLGWGGYLLHELWPGQRVFIDGQTDFYGEALTRDYLHIVELAEGWQANLDRYGVQWVIYQTDSAFVRELSAGGAWTTVFQDDVATVLVRRAAVAVAED